MSQGTKLPNAIMIVISCFEDALVIEPWTHGIRSAFYFRQEDHKSFLTLKKDLHRMLLRLAILD